jgi:hypothetical protein
MTARAMPVLFALVCVAGSTAAVTLLVREARSTAPVEAHVVGKARSGAVTTVTTDLRNTTRERRCVRVQWVASDRAGHDLARSPVRVVELDPHETARAVGRVVLTTKQYAEQLSTLHPTVAACGAERDVQK